MESNFNLYILWRYQSVIVGIQIVVERVLILQISVNPSSVWKGDLNIGHRIVERLYDIHNGLVRLF